MKNTIFFSKFTSILLTILVLFVLLPVHKIDASEITETVQVKKDWTDQEIIELGYIPDEVVIKFKKDRINLQTEIGRNKAKAFAQGRSNALAPGIINRLNGKPEKAQRLNELSSDDLAILNQDFFREKEQLIFANASSLKLNMDDSVMETIEELQNDPDVEYVIPNYVFEFTSTINDPKYLTDQWGAQKIQLQEAMNEVQETAQDVIVAVLDTGLSLNHPEFGTENLWDGSSNCKDENSQPIAGNCQNHGWDFVNNDDKPMDDYGHGTHVAGIIGAIKNADGVAGTSSNVKMMIVKVGNSYGSFVNIAKGINFAEYNNAKMINASFSGSKSPIGLLSAVASFTQENLFIAAAGNEKQDNDVMNSYPANYAFDNLISVGATESNDSIWDEGSFGSNYGATQVDIAAPGSNIMSTYLTREVKLNEGFLLGSMGGFEKVILDPPTPNYWDAVIWGSIDGELYSDMENFPNDENSTTHYTANMNASVISPSVDLSGAIDDTAVVHFDVWCDTEPKGSKTDQPDYLDVFAISPNGEVKLNIDAPISEDYLSDLDRPDESRNGLVGIIAEHTDTNKGLGYVIPDEHVTSATQLKFVWHTDGGDVGGPYRGCAIDNVKVIVFDEDTYYSTSGTSMAAPFVTGVAAMIMGAYPDLTASQVKEIIMQSGDYVSDLDPVTGTHPIASGKRLNAYRALVLAKQTSIGQNIILYPTIRAKETGGNWSYFGMWEEGRVPGPDDIVEINGNVTLNTDAEIAGLIIKNGAVLKPRQYSATPRYRTLTINGHVVNHGTIKEEYTHSDYYGDIILSMTGNLENTGSLEVDSLITSDLINSGSLNSSGPNISGDLVNSGAFNSSSALLGGNLENTGTVTSNSSITFQGTTSQQITSSSPLGYISVLNDTTINGNLTVEGRIYVDTGKTLSFGNENTITLNSWVNTRGSIDGGDLMLSGGDQRLNFEGTFNVNRMVIGGSGIKTYRDNKIVNGDIEVLSGVTLQPFKSFSNPETYNLKINGDLTNSGIVKNDYSNSAYFGTLKIELAGNLENTGLMENADTVASWVQDPNAEDYEIRFTDTDFYWLTPKIVNSYNISLKYLTESTGILWQVRPIINSEPGNWLLPYAVNASEVLIPQLSMTDAAGEEVTSGITIGFGEITLETPLQKTYTLKNTGFRNLEISSIGLSGDINYTIELLDGTDLLLQPEESKTFGINFKALEGETSGSRHTVFTFDTNDSSKPTFQINFTGQILMSDPAPVLTEVIPIPEMTTDKTPDYAFHSTETGTLSYEGPCQSPVTQINEGNTALTFNLLSSGYYDYCFLTVTDTDGNMSDSLPVSPFTVNQVTYENIIWDQVIDELALWQIHHDDLFQTEEKRLKQLEKAMDKYTKSVNKEKYPHAAQKVRKAIAANYTDIEGIVNDLKTQMSDDLDHLKRILIKKPMNVMYGEDTGDDTDDEDGPD